MFPERQVRCGIAQGVGEDRRCLSRLSRNASLMLIVMTLAAAVFWDWGGVLSILIGGVTALLNFRWLGRAVDQMLSVEVKAGRRVSSGRFLAGYLGRLLLILGGLFAIIYLSFLSLLGALLGFSIFVLAGFLEAVHLLLRNRGTS